MPKNQAPDQPASLPGTFVAIERRPDSHLFWSQAKCAWVDLLEADHYPSAEHAQALIAAQPHMHQFFRTATLRGFTVAPVNGPRPSVLSASISPS